VHLGAPRVQNKKGAKFLILNFITKYVIKITTKKQTGWGGRETFL
jgi:hypothetical protein